VTLEIREALEPVIDWYQSDEHPGRRTVDIVQDVVSDLQLDRSHCLQVQRLAQDAKRMCEEGAPVSAHNLACEVLKILRSVKEGS